MLLKGSGLRIFKLCNVYTLIGLNLWIRSSVVDFEREPVQGLLLKGSGLRIFKLCNVYTLIGLNLWIRSSVVDFEREPVQGLILKGFGVMVDFELCKVYTFFEKERPGLI